MTTSGFLVIVLLLLFVGQVRLMNDKDIHLKFELLFKEVTALKKILSYSTRYCKTLPTTTCGSCMCLDDWRNEKGYYCDCQALTPKRDCLEFHQRGYKISGVYQITMNSWFRGKVTTVYCDQTTEGGGWTVFQRRNDGSVDFYRNWHEYKHGFGDVRNEYWLGNDNIHDLAYQGHLYGNELRIDMKNYLGTWGYAKYGTFNMDGETSLYKLQVGSYSGNATDCLTYHNGKKFSTYDKDNDQYSSYHCAQFKVGAWWYYQCDRSGLNGQYTEYGGTKRGSGVYWCGISYLKWTEMKVRRKIS